MATRCQPRLYTLANNGERVPDSNGNPPQPAQIILIPSFSTSETFHSITLRTLQRYRWAQSFIRFTRAVQLLRLVRTQQRPSDGSAWHGSIGAHGCVMCPCPPLPPHSSLTCSSFADEPNKTRTGQLAHVMCNLRDSHATPHVRWTLPVNLETTEASKMQATVLACDDGAAEEDYTYTVLLARPCARCFTSAAGAGDTEPRLPAL